MHVIVTVRGIPTRPGMRVLVCTGWQRDFGTKLYGPLARQEAARIGRCMNKEKFFQPFWKTFICSIFHKKNYLV